MIAISLRPQNTHYELRGRNQDQRNCKHGSNGSREQFVFQVHVTLHKNDGAIVNWLRHAEIFFHRISFRIPDRLET